MSDLNRRQIEEWLENVAEVLDGQLVRVWINDYRNLCRVALRLAQAERKRDEALRDFESMKNDIKAAEARVHQLEVALREIEAGDNARSSRTLAREALASPPVSARETKDAT